VLGVDYDFIVEGDDNIIFLKDLELFEKASEFIRMLGFSQTTEHYDTTNEIEFVGLKFFLTEEGGLLTYRDPLRVFKKLSYASL